MEYLYAIERPDFSDLSSGRVFYSLPGHPAFPVRLASEIFQRCLAIRARAGGSGRCVLYDPCCGTGYLAGVTGYLHRPELRAVIGSDVDGTAVEVAAKSLSLLQPEGLQQRLEEIAGMIQRFGKESHQEAYQSGRRMMKRIQEEEQQFPLRVKTFQADVFDASALTAALAGTPVDIVITDIPYGLHSEWQGSNEESPVESLLKSLKPVLAPRGIVAIASDKHQKVAHPVYRRIEHFQVGKRKVTILTPVD